MFIKKLLLLLPILWSGAEASLSCVITNKALQPLITFALPRTLQMGGGGEAVLRQIGKSKGAVFFLIYFFSLCTAFLLIKKKKLDKKEVFLLKCDVCCLWYLCVGVVFCCSFLFGFFFFFTRIVLYCLDFKSYYIFRCYEFWFLLSGFFYSISCLFPRECPELFVSNCYLGEDCNFELVNT